MITFVGGGIRALNQLTLDGIEALQASNKVLTFQYELEFFERHNIHSIECLASLYEDGARDDDNYNRLITKIEEEAVKHERLVVLLPGHPRVGVSIVQKFAHRSDVVVLPGISSFCTMINDLEVDPLEKGSVVIDVNRLLLFDLKIVPELDYYLYHICSIGVAQTYFSEPSRMNAIHILAKKLSEAYPETHVVTLIGSATENGDKPTRLQVEIGKIDSVLSHIRFETSLYIPAIHPKSYNHEFLARLQGVAAGGSND